MKFKSKDQKLRAGDLKNTVRYTDSLVRMFSNDNFLLGHARAGGLLAVDRLPPLRKWLARQSMGINYRQSRLARRGLALRVENMNAAIKQYDVIINGCAMVCATLACLLAKAGRKVAMIEASPIASAKEFDPESVYDLRVSAISRASQQAFIEIGAWDEDAGNACLTLRNHGCLGCRRRWSCAL